MLDKPDDNADLILDAVLRSVAFDGWTQRNVMSAVRGLGLPRGAEHIYAADGALGLIRRWSGRLDSQMAERLQARGLDNMRIRDKVTEAVWIRLNLMQGHEEAARRAMARLALPDASAQALEQLWASADAIWTAIGDTSEDYNYYTKRTILSAVIGSSVVTWLSDDSDDKHESRAFLERRIGNVMQFEKFKGQALNALSAAPKPEALFQQQTLFAPKAFFDKLRKGRSRRRTYY